MIDIQRKKSPTVMIGDVSMGSQHPIVVQSMTNTPTADIEATLKQIMELADAGSELVRITVNDFAAMEAVPSIINTLRSKEYTVPIVGDFHYNGHILLAKYPEAAKLLDKYRINPGNVGKGSKRDENFSTMIEMAIKYDKPVRIGVNWGSLDQDLFTEMMNENAALEKPEDFKTVVIAAMVKSALVSAQLAEKIGLAKNKIVLSRNGKIKIIDENNEKYSSNIPFGSKLLVNEGENVTINKNTPDEIDSYKAPDEKNLHLPKILTELGITKSNSEARRLINAGSFKIDDQKFTELDVETDKLLNKTLQLGKRTFFTFI